MPEGPEVETERLHEAIQEELERDGGGFLKRIAVSTALFAALAALRRSVKFGVFIARPLWP